MPGTKEVRVKGPAVWTGTPKRSATVGSGSPPRTAATISSPSSRTSAIFFSSERICRMVGSASSSDMMPAGSLDTSSSA